MNYTASPLLRVQAALCQSGFRDDTSVAWRTSSDGYASPALGLTCETMDTQALWVSKGEFVRHSGASPFRADLVSAGLPGRFKGESPEGKPVARAVGNSRRPRPPHTRKRAGAATRAEESSGQNSLW